jgi:hypothetical protein
LGELEARQTRYRQSGVRGCWFVRHPPRSRAPNGSADLVARPDLPLFPLVGGDKVARVQLGGGTYPLEEVVTALLSRRIAFRTHRTAVGEQVLEITFYEKHCPACRTGVQFYTIAPSADQPLTSACGQRLLVWSEAVYHPEIARLARGVYQAIVRESVKTMAPLALVQPAVGFHCPHCRHRLAPQGAGDPVHAMVHRAHAAFTRPLCDPYPHWCYPADGVFCAQITPP